MAKNQIYNFNKSKTHLYYNLNSLITVFLFLDNNKKAKSLSLAPIEVEILFFFSLKKKRLQRKAGHYFQKSKIFLLQINCFIITSPLETQNPQLKPWVIAIILKL
jgi:hypothetical protein